MFKKLPGLLQFQPEYFVGGSARFIWLYFTIWLRFETTIGRYLVECVKVLDRVARRMERSGGAGYAKDAILEDLRQKAMAAAVVLANSLPNAKLFVFTRYGKMACNVSNTRPEHAPIFAFTPSEQVYRQLVMCWGAFPICIDFAEDPNATLQAAETHLRDAKLVAPNNDNLVIMSDVRAGRAFVDCVQLHAVGK